MICATTGDRRFGGLLQRTVFIGTTVRECLPAKWFLVRDWSVEDRVALQLRSG
jgi:hypothetical protein